MAFPTLAWDDLPGRPEEGSSPRVSVARSHYQAYKGVFTASLGELPSSGAVLPDTEIR